MRTNLRRSLVVVAATAAGLWAVGTTASQAAEPSVAPGASAPTDTREVAGGLTDALSADSRQVVDELTGALSTGQLPATDTEAVDAVEAVGAVKDVEAVVDEAAGDLDGTTGRLAEAVHHLYGAAGDAERAADPVAAVHQAVADLTTEVDGLTEGGLPATPELPGTAELPSVTPYTTDVSEVPATSDADELLGSLTGTGVEPGQVAEDVETHLSELRPAVDETVARVLPTASTLPAVDAPAVPDLTDPAAIPTVPAVPTL